MIFMIKLTDRNGIEHNINLNYVISVSLPSGDNLNELLRLTIGPPILLLAGTWQATIDAFFVEFNANPQPMPNVKDKVFIAL